MWILGDISWENVTKTIDIFSMTPHINYTPRRFEEIIHSEEKVAT